MLITLLGILLYIHRGSDIDKQKNGGHIFHVKEPPPPLRVPTILCKVLQFYIRSLYSHIKFRKILMNIVQANISKHMQCEGYMPYRYFI